MPSVSFSCLVAVARTSNTMLNKNGQSGPDWYAWLGIVLQSERSLVQFPVRAQAWVAVWVPGQGKYRRQPYQCFSLTTMFLSLSSSFPSPLSKDKDEMAHSLFEGFRAVRSPISRHISRIQETKYILGFTTSFKPRKSKKQPRKIRPIISFKFS